jgi:hypothetical protein
MAFKMKWKIIIADLFLELIGYFLGLDIFSLPSFF